MTEQWTEEQQRALNEALITYPVTMERSKRWKLIASKVPGKNMRDCIARVKAISEIINTAEKGEEPKALDLKTCSPKDVLSPYYAQIQKQSQKYMEMVIKEISQSLILDANRVKSIFRPIIEEALPDSKKVDAVLNDLVTVLDRIVNENSEKEVKKCETSQLIGEKDVFVHQERKVNDEYVVEMKKKKEKVVDVKKEEEDDYWEDNDRSIDTIFLPRSRGPIGRSRNIDLKRVNVTIKSKELLAGATLRLHEGYHYGLVGRNGCGKSTLLRRMALNRIDNFPDYLLVLHVKQEVEGNDESVLDTVIQSDKERINLLLEHKELEEKLSQMEHDEVEISEVETLVKRIQEIDERLKDIKSDTAEIRAHEILEGLEFSEEKMNMPTKHLSGGWRMRTSIACALFIQPDILLLDEPTNHLDLQAIIWLQEYIKSYPRTTIVVSHDRQFLNEISQEIIEFTCKELRYWPGDYNSYAKAKENKEKMMNTLQQNLDDKRNAIKEQIAKMQQRASKNEKGGNNAMIHSRTLKMNRMGIEKTLDGKKYVAQVECAPRIGSINSNTGGWNGHKRTAGSFLDAPEPVIKFSIPPCEAITYNGPILQLSDVSFAYPNTVAPLFEHVTFDVTMGKKIALLGPNGIGKSTFLGVLNSTLTPQAGEIYRYHNLKIGYFAQHHIDALDNSICALEHMKRISPLSKDQELRSVLGSFGISGSLAIQPIATLSGGQKSRVVFATISFNQPHILLLDEPTNHLDLDTIEVLIESLKSFNGGLVVVTHDQYLVDEVCNALYVVDENKRIHLFEGSFNDYKKYCLKHYKNSE